MRTRGIIAVGLVASAATVAAPAFGQGDVNAPPPPGGGPAVNIAVPTPPPADRPLITRVPPPRAFIIDAGAGVLGYVGGTGGVGPAWNVRVTADFARRFAAEGNYVGSVNRRSDNTGSLTYQSVDAGIRYNILRADEAPVQPYVSAGLGWAGWFGPGGTPAALVIPVAAGVERMLTDRIKIGARFNIRPSFFENLGIGNEPNPGGSSWALVANVGGGF